MTVVFREEALADLDEIARFISRHNSSAADRVITRIHKTIYQTIGTLPLSGRLNPSNSTSSLLDVHRLIARLPAAMP